MRKFYYTDAWKYLRMGYGIVRFPDSIFFHTHILTSSKYTWHVCHSQAFDIKIYGIPFNNFPPLSGQFPRYFNPWPLPIHQFFETICRTRSNLSANDGLVSSGARPPVVSPSTHAIQSFAVKALRCSFREQCKWDRFSKK